MQQLGFGMMRLPLNDEADQKSIDLDQVIQMTDTFLRNGFVYFDTAYGYHAGLSERTLKTALTQRHSRDAFVVADKMPVWLVKKPADYARLFAEQCARTGLSYFDYYMLHALDHKSYQAAEKHGGFAFLAQMKQEHKVHQIGISFHDRADVLARILTKHPELDFVQLQINYADWEDPGVESRKCYEVACKHEVPVIVMEPVKGGSLATVSETVEKLLRSHDPQQSPVSWALRYAASLENVFMVLSGMSSLEQLQQNIACFRDFRPLNKQEAAIVQQAANLIRQSIAIPCTACQYCVESCPQHIPIASYFAFYNDAKRFQRSAEITTYYRAMAETHGRAADCIACKVCEDHCPQHIAIAAQMAHVSALFDR